MPSITPDSAISLTTLFVNAAGRAETDAQSNSIFAHRVSHLLFNGEFDTVDNFLEELRDSFMQDIHEMMLDGSSTNYAKLHAIAWALGQAMPYRFHLTNIASVAHIIETHPLWLLPATHSSEAKRFHAIFRGCGLSRKTNKQ